MLARDMIENMASRGRYSFTSEEARLALNTTPDASKLALHRLAKQGRIASPARGFHVIVPPEYRSLDCLPADQFIPDLMRHKGLAYYIGLLTAAQYHGAAHHRPQEFQVFVQKNRRPIHCGQVRVSFIARNNISEVPTARLNTPRGELTVSTPEATAIDLAGYQTHAGGLNQVATLLAELADEIDPATLVDAASTAPVTWSQRLGYMLELVGASNTAMNLKAFVRERANEYRLLAPGASKNGQRLPDWKLIVNEALEPDL